MSLLQETLFNPRILRSLAVSTSIGPNYILFIYFIVLHMNGISGSIGQFVLASECLELIIWNVSRSTIKKKMDNSRKLSRAELHRLINYGVSTAFSKLLVVFLYSHSLGGIEVGMKTALFLISGPFELCKLAYLLVPLSYRLIPYFLGFELNFLGITACCVSNILGAFSLVQLRSFQNRDNVEIPLIARGISAMFAIPLCLLVTFSSRVLWSSEISVLLMFAISNVVRDKFLFYCGTSYSDGDEQDFYEKVSAIFTSLGIMTLEVSMFPEKKFSWLIISLSFTFVYRWFFLSSYYEMCKDCCVCFVVLLLVAVRHSHFSAPVITWSLSDLYYFYPSVLDHNDFSVYRLKLVIVAGVLISGLVRYRNNVCDLSAMFWGNCQHYFAGCFSSASNFLYDIGLVCRQHFYGHVTIVAERIFVIEVADPIPQENEELLDTFRLGFIGSSLLRSDVHRYENDYSSVASSGAHGITHGLNVNRDY